MATYYRWGRYTTKYVSKNYGTMMPYSYYGSASRPKVLYTTVDYPSPEIDQTTGKIKESSYPSEVNLTTGNSLARNVEFFSFSNQMDRYYYNYMDYNPLYFSAIREDDAASAYISGNKDASCTCYRVVLGPDVFQSYVYSTSSSAYPNGGASGSYYYQNRTQVTSPTAPASIAYPANITDAAIEVSWPAASSNTSYAVKDYALEYAVNGSAAWTAAGTYTGTSATVTVPAGVTSIAFRVRARDTNNQYGAYVTGEAASISNAPALTVPVAIMQGAAAVLSWTAVEGAAAYTLQRKTNSDSDFVQLYSGTATSYSDTAGSWTTVQYRVRAEFDSVSSGWDTSALITLLDPSTISISGTDGDLGLITSDVQFSVLSDTGNPITVEVVSGAYSHSFGAESGDTLTISILDLLAGAGAIKITASAQNTTGTVTATRSWTYTKPVMQFDTKGVSLGTIELGGVPQYPNTLAECVRLPGGKTLDTAFAELLAGGAGGGEGEDSLIVYDTPPASLELKPNVLYDLSASAASSLTVTLAAGKAGQINEYNFIFKSGSTAASLTLPASVKKPGDFVVEANRIYQISILQNLMCAQSWEVS